MADLCTYGDCLRPSDAGRWEEEQLQQSTWAPMRFVAPVSLCLAHEPRSDRLIRLRLPIYAGGDQAGSYYETVGWLSSPWSETHEVRD